MNTPIAGYVARMQGVLSSLPLEDIQNGYELLRDAAQREGTIYLCGNGGSAATASHLAVDLGKNVPRTAGRAFRVHSLTDNVPWLTAIANDLEYADCFAAQLRHALLPDDLLIGISASGNSANVLRAFEWARDRGVERIALVGFDGGRLAPMATQAVRVDSWDYGIVENVHLMIAHVWVRLLTDGLASSTTGGFAEPAAHERALTNKLPAEELPIAAGEVRRARPIQGVPLFSVSRRESVAPSRRGPQEHRELPSESFDP